MKRIAAGRISTHPEIGSYDRRLFTRQTVREHERNSQGAER
jgi:hypothetical protein